MPDRPRVHRSLRVAVTDERGRPLRAGDLASWLRDIAPARARGVVSIALVRDRTMRRLNRRFAGLDRVTDVLSFSASEASGAATGVGRGNVDACSRAAPDAGPRGRLGTGPRFRPGRGPGAPAGEATLGDIVIATGVARRQAADVGHPYSHELRVLALHGLLHLVGYEHHGDQETMARLEARLRRKGGLGEGLIERARRT